MKRVNIFIITLALMLGGLPPAGAAEDCEEKALPIIMYHEVRPGNLGRDAISPAEFEGDLKYLKNQGYTAVTMSEVIDFVYRRAPLPPKPVVISFDDGCLTTYKNVFPLLEKYDMRIVLAVIAKAAQDFSAYPVSAEYAHMTWGQISEMKQAGRAEIQNHTYNLHKFGKSRVGCAQKRDESVSQYEKVLREDTAKAQQMICENTGSTPDTFVYPYGKYNDNTERIAKKLGFSATLSCRYGVNLLSVDDTECLYSMKRIGRAHGRSAGKLLEEAYKTIK